VAPAGQAPADSFGARSAENGYWPKSVQLGLDRTLGSVLIDGEGFTLYRFEKDSAAPPKATCVGECGRVWPPVLVNEKITFRNLDAGLIGAVTRQDGTQQLTVAGHPAYRYVEDAVPGQTNGQAVDGAWFVLGPDGGRAGAQQPAP
jgi:predicted lipoprotein with Yx(FWY)xxD motif